MIRTTGSKITLCCREKAAKTFFERLTGMLFRRFDDTVDGMLFDSCGSIHTFGMRYAIDVLFFTEDMKITAMRHNMAPWKIFFSGTLKKCSCLELPAGTLDRAQCKTGDFIEITQ